MHATCRNMEIYVKACSARQKVVRHGEILSKGSIIFAAPMVYFASGVRITVERFRTCFV
jgi:hypothetical protein